MFIAYTKVFGSIAATGNSRAEVIAQLARYGIDRSEVTIKKAP